MNTQISKLTKILDSDNNILKKTVLLKKHGLISDNLLIGLITILGACFIFIFILKMSNI